MKVNVTRVFVTNILEKTSSINYKYVILGNIIHQNQTYFTVYFFTRTYWVSCGKFSILSLILRKTLLHFFLYTLFPNLLMLNVVQTVRSS